MCLSVSRGRLLPCNQHEPIDLGELLLAMGFNPFMPFSARFWANHGLQDISNGLKSLAPIFGTSSMTDSELSKAVSSLALGDQKPLGYSYFPKELSPTPESWVRATAKVAWCRKHDKVGIDLVFLYLFLLTSCLTYGVLMEGIIGRAFCSTRTAGDAAARFGRLYWKSMEMTGERG